MHPPALVDEALALLAEGTTASEVSRLLGVNRRTVADWSLGRTPDRSSRRPCFRCEAVDPGHPAAYVHLLGLYLGDGCISRHRNGRVHSLRVTCDAAYPGLIQECEDVIRLVRDGPVSRVPKVGCFDVQAWWRHWPCLFPQHGPGRKHERPIVLEPWQRELVELHPGRFLRGLFHSDGCRVQNWATKTVGGVTTRYEGYPRYFFSNRSEDLIGLCTWALDLLGVRWTRPTADHVSVARRASVAELDRHVGPKA
jgi:hypothetical protein